MQFRSESELFTGDTSKDNHSPDEWQQRRMILNNSCSQARTSSFTHPFQHFSRKDYDALEEYNGKVSIDGRTITSLRFADDTDALAEEEQELEA